MVGLKDWARLAACRQEIEYACEGCSVSAKGTNSRIYCAAQSKGDSDANVRISDRPEFTAAGGKRNGGGQEGMCYAQRNSREHEFSFISSSNEHGVVHFSGDDGTEHILHTTPEPAAALATHRAQKFLFCFHFLTSTVDLSKRLGDWASV